MTVLLSAERATPRGGGIASPTVPSMPVVLFTTRNLRMATPSDENRLES